MGSSADDIDNIRDNKLYFRITAGVTLISHVLDTSQSTIQELISLKQSKNAHGER